MLQGFKDFIMRGNVIDLAVAVVIGSAFTAIVTAFSDHLINPLLAVLGSPEVEGLGFELRPGNSATMIDFGAIITAILNFLIIAAVIYFVIVMPMNKLNELRVRRLEVEEGTEEVAPEVALLEEIRDVLKNQGTANSGGVNPGTPREE